MLCAKIGVETIMTDNVGVNIQLILRYFKSNFKNFFNVSNLKHSNLILRYLMKHKLNTDRMRDISNHDASCNAF